MERRRSIRPAVALLCALLAAAPSVASGWELQGRKTITAVTRGQERIALGTVHFEPRGDGSATFVVALEHARFSDHFLSMKEFKCLEGTGELVCHVPYPYAHPASVSRNNLAWLEHSLLFFFKLPGEFGAKLWNGLYFRLEPDERGLLGRPQAVDLNTIGAPPDRLNEPPFEPSMRSDISPGARWIESLIIE